MTTARKRRRLPSPSAEALLYSAQEYLLGAKMLFAIPNPPSSPVYFLYTHAIELALKVYIRSRGEAVRRTHDLESLLDACRVLGLDVSRDLSNVVSLLDSEHRVQGFRYFAPISTALPDLPYLSQVVDIFMASMPGAIKTSSTERPSDAAALRIVVGKPQPK